MATETIKKVVLKRVPPGDNWAYANSKNSAVYTSLTDALEAHYQFSGETQFFIDAREGTISIFDTKEVIEIPKKFSLYGED